MTIRVTGDRGTWAKLSLVSWLAVELLALKRAFVSQLAGWLAVELLALKRGVCVAVSWLAFLLSGRAAGCTRAEWAAATGE
jgi:hypothetical protein